MEAKGRIVVLTLPILMAFGAAGSNAWAQARNIFQRVSVQLDGDGYVATGNTSSGWLNRGGETTWSVWLNAGNSYAVAATCDRDCTDVDLRLISPGGLEIDSDLGDDDEPIVFATPSRSGYYRVRVSMPKCSVQPCEYFVGSFRR
jgi:hypothetical protein